MNINLKVLDLSHHNQVTDFKALYDFGIRGIIHKATQGSGNIDRTYATRRAQALDAGLLWGAYHFADGSAPQAQLDHFLDAAKLGPGDLGALDYEPLAGNTMSLQNCMRFLQGYEAARGTKAVLYSGNLIKETLAGPSAFFAAHRLWLAHYNDKPKIPAAWGANLFLHQFSDGAVNNHGIKVPGVTGNVDLDSFAGDDAALAAAWAG